jgi:uncharacterized membrane protein YwzB
MLNLLITLVVVVLVLCLVYWAIHRLASAFGLSSQVVTVLDVVLVIIFVVLLARLLLGNRLDLAL